MLLYGLFFKESHLVILNYGLKCKDYNSSTMHLYIWMLQGLIIPIWMPIDAKRLVCEAPLNM